MMLPAFVMLGGCAFLSDAVWPSLTGAPPAAPAAPPATPPPPSQPPQTPAEVAQARKQIDTQLAAVDDTLGALEARISFYDEQQIRLNSELSDHRGLLEALNPEEAPDPAEAWGTLQIGLSRLDDDRNRLEALRGEVGADTARAAQQLAVLNGIDTAPAVTPAQTTRASGLRQGITGLLAALGERDAALGHDMVRWQAFSDRQDARLTALTPQVDEPAQPAAPPRRTPSPPIAQPTSPAPAVPLDSGDRFKGRQALATLNFADPDLAFESQLTGLLDRVQAQFPDVAFDVETVGADAGALARVLAVLAARDIASDVYQTPLDDGAAPEIRLYPR